MTKKPEIVKEEGLRADMRERKQDSYIKEYRDYYQKRLLEYLSWGRKKGIPYYQNMSWISKPISDISNNGSRDWTKLNINFYESHGFYIVEFIVPKYEELLGSLTDQDIEDGGFASDKLIKDDVELYERKLSGINEYFLSNEVLYNLSPFHENNRNNLNPKDFPKNNFRYAFVKGEVIWSWQYPQSFKNKQTSLKIDDMNIYYLINDTW